MNSDLKEGTSGKLKDNFGKKNRAFLRIKRHFWKTKGQFQGNKRTLPKNKRAILGIKKHFWKVKKHLDLKTRPLATSPSLWSGHFWMSKFLLGTHASIHT